MQWPLRKSTVWQLATYPERTQQCFGHFCRAVLSLVELLKLRVLEQGGLEIPCALIFQDSSQVEKVKRLMKEAEEKAKEEAEAKEKA